MPSRTIFAIQSEHVVHETIDGETVIFHLQTGVYYSLAGSGVAIWEAIQQGCTVEEIADQLVDGQDAAREDVEVAIVKLVADLEQEGLIEAGPAPTDQRRPRRPDSPRCPFVAPVLAKYDDMQDLLLIDPLHEVEEREGWPVKKGASAP